MWILRSLGTIQKNHKGYYYSASRHSFCSSKFPPIKSGSNPQMLCLILYDPGNSMYHSCGGRIYLCNISYKATIKLTSQGSRKGWSTFHRVAQNIAIIFSYNKCQDNKTRGCATKQTLRDLILGETSHYIFYISLFIADRISGYTQKETLLKKYEFVEVEIFACHLLYMAKMSLTKRAICPFQSHYNPTYEFMNILRVFIS